MITLSSQPQTSEKKGVPGFSARLGWIFDLVGVPADTRLSWGAKRWNVVPNTVRNWTKLDTPPSNFSTLDFVVGDLLHMLNASVDKTAVMGWLYAGGANPFDPVAAPQPVNHIVQIKIFNFAFSVSSEMGIDLNSVPERTVNEIINAAYVSVMKAGELSAQIDIKATEPLLRELLSSLAHANEKL